MTLLRAILHLRSPFGTPLAGDTFFGQACHAARDALGEAALTDLLEGYTSGRPWLVVSDGFPHGYLPRPSVPVPPHADPSRRKEDKAKHWIPHAAAAQPLNTLLGTAVSDEAAFGEHSVPVQASAYHNTLNRLSGTTGTGEFAPYTQPQTHYAAGQRIDLWCVLDETRLPVEGLRQLFAQIGSLGYGRDASIGLGKFDIESLQEVSLPAPDHADAWWSLGPCAPQGQGFDGTRSSWRVLTRFGRHGGALALGASPFKNPVILAAAGAIFVPEKGFSPQHFVGSGLGQVSVAQPATVHQGYAPVVAVQVGETP